MDSISVVINGYRRPEYLKEQYESILNQSVPVNEILFWKNSHNDDNLFDQNIIDNCKSSISNNNFGVWSRFSYALNCKSKYICIFDDDTIPGENWLSSCLETIKKNNGLIGERGLIFNSNEYWNGSVGYSGRETKNKEAVMVDIVGHSWFFEREWLAAYWSELPPPEITLAGEDMHFSYMLQKRLGLNTYVAPHPEDDMSVWGSIKGSIGGDEKATSSLSESKDQMSFYLKHIISNGFKIINNNK